MCGILGIVLTDPSRSPDPQMVRRAADTMRHRGPDDSGCFISANAALAVRRLVVMDPRAGHQPISNEDRSVTLAYNGEAYNFLELRAELAARGHRFQTSCDTEAVLRAYEEWGVECLDRLNGMFAFGVWDGRDRSLIVARDRFGIKPLYYYHDDEKFLFASEVRALAATGLAPRELNFEALDAYLSLGYVPGPETLFRGIRKLEPGHFLRLRQGRLENQRYWDLAGIEERPTPFPEARDRVRALLQDSVEMQMMSDVPLGVLLSGGLDSSAVLALASRRSAAPLKTFTVTYGDQDEESEGEAARSVARRFGAEHRACVLGPQDFCSSIEASVERSEEPLAAASGIALHRVAELASREVVVLLSGEGSDEIFAGYHMYEGLADPGQGRLRDWRELPLGRRNSESDGLLCAARKRRFYDDGFHGEKGDYLERTFAAHFRSVSGGRGSALGQLLYLDLKTWMADYILTKADKMTMAVSTELRVPFLDHRLVEFAASLPAEYKLQGGSEKLILKSALEGIVPPDVIGRKKRGFPVPVRSWFAGPLFPSVRERLLDGRGQLPWLKADGLEAALREHQQGEFDHSKWLMALLALLAWRKRFML